MHLNFIVTPDDLHEARYFSAIKSVIAILNYYKLPVLRIQLPENYELVVTVMKNGVIKLTCTDTKLGILNVTEFKSLEWCISSIESIHDILRLPGQFIIKDDDKVLSGKWVLIASALFKSNKLELKTNKEVIDFLESIPSVVNLDDREISALVTSPRSFYIKPEEITTTQLI